MGIRNSGDRFGALAMVFHWTTVVLIVCAWSLGQGMDILPKGAARDAGVLVHISLGLAVLLVVVARFAWRMADPQPDPIPSRFGRLSEILATLVHYALYALLVATPIAGLTYWFAKGNALPVLGLIDIPSPLGSDPAFAKTVIGVHATLANAIVILAGFHAAAALVHHYILRDNTLTRMLPHQNSVAGKPGAPIKRPA